LADNTTHPHGQTRPWGGDCGGRGYGGHVISRHPASEILASVVTFAKETGAELYAEWSVNEKVAFEVAPGQLHVRPPLGGIP